MDTIVNLKLLAHPINWLIVWVVLLFAGFAWALVHESTGAASTATHP